MGRFPGSRSLQILALGSRGPAERWNRTATFQRVGELFNNLNLRRGAGGIAGT